MRVPYGDGDKHAAKLKKGLEHLGVGFVAQLCYWCEGTTTRKFESCHVCGRGRVYGTSLGLLINNQPAPESVVNQVLVAAERLAHGDNAP